jgi:predicted TIM-barrel fold metal-dependent hydrolase
MPPTVDMHVHVGVLGEPGSESGFISREMQAGLTFKIFLLYARIPPAEVSDARFRAAVRQVIQGSTLDRVVCLALDAVYDSAGVRDLKKTTMWVPNAYVLGLRAELPGKVLFGASVHPYDPAFQTRVRQAVQDGAVLLKWLPSAQQINLADPRVGDALRFLATAGRGGLPLPLLLHVGTEGAIISTDPRTMSYDFLSWGFWDRLGNTFRPKRARWHTPQLSAVHANLHAGLEAGACIIFAHCGLPYFAPRFATNLEHSDFDVVRDYLRRHRGIAGTIRGKAFADVSACVTPFRQTYFPDIRELPPDAVLTGSDYPVPIFELSADLQENMRDFKAIMRGDLERVVIPQGNLLDVNMQELRRVFPGHPMFINAAQLPNWT